MPQLVRRYYWVVCIAAMSDTKPAWPASTAQEADWPRLVEAWGSLKHDLPLNAASGEPPCSRYRLLTCCGLTLALALALPSPSPSPNPSLDLDSNQLVGVMTMLWTGRLRTRTLQQRRGLSLRIAFVVAVAVAAMQYLQGFLTQVRSICTACGHVYLSLQAHSTECRLSAGTARPTSCLPAAGAPLVVVAPLHSPMGLEGRRVHRARASTARAVRNPRRCHVLAG